MPALEKEESTIRYIVPSQDKYEAVIYKPSRVTVLASSWKEASSRVKRVIKEHNNKEGAGEEQEDIWTLLSIRKLV